MTPVQQVRRTAPRAVWIREVREPGILEVEFEALLAAHRERLCRRRGLTPVALAAQAERVLSAIPAQEGMPR
jgi:hypothetical protein